MADCASCGAELPSEALVCPSCQALVHADQLKVIAARAQAERHPSEALVHWRQALELLPPQSKQHLAIRGRIERLVKQVDEGPAPSAEAGVLPQWATAGGLGTLALLIWKGKWFVGLLLTKGKLLFTGLAKGKTMLSILLTIPVYWSLFGWKFAVGLIGSIYVHEIGHVAALRSYGIKASAPMFIPGLGAVIRMEQYPTSAGEDARVGLAGPIWGLGCAVFCYAVGMGMNWPSWLAVAQFGAVINLFNMVPVWQLDGGRGFRALSRSQRIGVLAVLGGTWFFLPEGMLLLVMLGGIYRLVTDTAPLEGDTGVFLRFCGLVVALGLLSRIPVPGLP